MNPPPFLEISAELLDVAEKAMHNYLASGNCSPVLSEIVTNLLLGGEWGCFDSVFFEAYDHEIYIKSGVLNMLPSPSELKTQKNSSSRDKWNRTAYNHFVMHLSKKPKPQ
jgi:hypothetical protein